MTENKKISFEERLTAWAGEDNVKAAKSLLKGSVLAGVWRNSNLDLCGCFNLPKDKIFTSVISGTVPVSKCRCSDTSDKLCPHACALIMYAGRFGNPLGNTPVESTPNYFSGLRKESWVRLSERTPEKPAAQLVIEAQNEAPHAPSKWEDITVSVRIVTRERSFPGNLNNLRQLYFDKSLSVVVKFEHFDLQEQQIIRFLALYGEPDGSKINLEADMTSEFFHCLINYPRFTRGGCQIKVRGDKADVVVVKNANKFYPGLRVAGALLPVSGARVISGRSGCWIGAGGEYFFVPASCEVGFLRNFFRSGTQQSGKDGISEERVRRLPFPVINLKNPEPETAPLQIMLDGKLDSGGCLQLDVKYIYHIGENSIAAPVKSGELIASGYRFTRRNPAKERAFEQQLAMFGFTFTDNCFSLDSIAKTGLFLEHALPAMLDGPFAPVLAPGLHKLAALNDVVLKCSYTGLAGDSHKVSYSINRGGDNIVWDELFELAKQHGEYLCSNGRLFRIPAPLGAFLRAIPSMVKSIDTELEEFTVPHCNTNFYTRMTQNLPDAAVKEFFIPQNCVQTAANAPAAGKFKFSGTLREYQQQGVDFLCRMTDLNYNVILADEMGLGKTVQLLAMLGRRLHQGSQPALIIAPASLITNWAREAEKFLPGIRVVTPEGNDRKIIWKEPDSYDLAIISYTAARIAGDKLKLVRFSYLVLDEAQHIKNPGSGNAKNCKSIAAEHKIVLSGTPLENSPEDLWSIFDFLHPGMLGSAASFKKRYTGSGTTPELHNELACRIGPFILRRTKNEVAADLPERTEKIVYCDFSADQRALYENILEQGRKELAEAGNDKIKGNASIFNTLLKLRQVCCAPALLADGCGSETASAKEELLQELVNEILDSSHKMLVFSQFTSMLKRMIPSFEEKKIDFEYLDGSTKNRQQRVDNFNKSDTPLFLLSLKAGGTGLNLTSADTVIIYDPWWNPAAELQAADRTHRIGQTKPVTVYKLVVRNSIEEKILALQGAKRELFNQVVEASQDESAKLSIEELKELLEM